MTIQEALRFVVASFSMLPLVSSRLVSSLPVSSFQVSSSQADQPVEARTAAAVNSSASGSAHPLEPPLVTARTALYRIEREILDYTCTLLRQERVSGKLLPAETIFSDAQSFPHLCLGHARQSLSRDRIWYREARATHDRSGGAGIGP